MVDSLRRINQDPHQPYDFSGSSSDPNVGAPITATTTVSNGDDSLALHRFLDKRRVLSSRETVMRLAEMRSVVCDRLDC